MTLDVRTIVVMLILCSVLMAATLAVGNRTGGAFGFAKWTLGLGMYALGWLLIAVRGWLPEVLTMATADALLLAGLCLQLAAIIEFGQGTAPRWLLYAPGPLLFAVTLPLMENYAAFTCVAGASFMIAMIAIAVATLRLGARAGAARWMLAGSYGFAGLTMVLRIAAILTDPAAQAGLYAPGMVHAASFISIFAVTSVGSIAFLLMLRELAEAEIRHLAMFDPLTELFNRRAFMDLAGRELDRARRANGPVAVLMMDLDWFKRVNDDFGHQAGDLVLAEFAATVKRCMRSGDLACRYGGEEFCAVLPGADAETALAVANRVRIAASERPLGGIPRTTTVSIGFTIAGPGEGVTLDQAIACADEALYEAKNRGRDRVASRASASRTLPKGETAQPEPATRDPQTPSRNAAEQPAYTSIGH